MPLLFSRLRLISQIKAVQYMTAMLVFDTTGLQVHNKRRRTCTCIGVPVQSFLLLGGLAYVGVGGRCSARAQGLLVLVAQFKLSLTRDVPSSARLTASRRSRSPPSTSLYPYPCD